MGGCVSGGVDIGPLYRWMDGQVDEGVDGEKEGEWRVSETLQSHGRHRCDKAGRTILFYVRMEASQQDADLSCIPYCWPVSHQAMDSGLKKREASEHRETQAILHFWL